jgi:hypothetical protein
MWLLECQPRLLWITIKPIFECQTHLIFKAGRFFMPTLNIFREQEKVLVSATIVHSGGEEGRFKNDTPFPFRTGMLLLECQPRLFWRWDGRVFSSTLYIS